MAPIHIAATAAYSGSEFRLEAIALRIRSFFANFFRYSTI